MLESSDAVHTVETMLRNWDLVIQCVPPAGQPTPLQILKMDIEQGAKLLKYQEYRLAYKILNFDISLSRRGQACKLIAPAIVRVLRYE